MAKQNIQIRKSLVIPAATLGFALLLAVVCLLLDHSADRPEPNPQVTQQILWNSTVCDPRDHKQFRPDDKVYCVHSLETSAEPIPGVLYPIATTDEEGNVIDRFGDTCDTASELLYYLERNWQCNALDPSPFRPLGDPPVVDMTPGS